MKKGYADACQDVLRPGRRPRPLEGQDDRRDRLWQPGSCPGAKPARLGMRSGDRPAAGLGQLRVGGHATGFKPVSAAEAAEAGDLINILLPDEVQGDIYARDIKPQLRPGDLLLCSHGFNIHFGQVVPPEGVDCALVAPKGPGHLVRSEFVKGGGVPCLIATERKLHACGQGPGTRLCQGNRRHPRRRLADHVCRGDRDRPLRRAGRPLRRRERTCEDGFETLIEAGYQPESAYFECLHELKLIVDLMYQGGLNYMRYSISNTAEYGDYTRGPRIVNEATRAEMKKILAEIRSGQFAREWILENRANRPVFNATKRLEREHPVEQVGKTTAQPDALDRCQDRLTQPR